MDMELMDKISDLQITLKQAKAILDGFTNEFTSGDLKSVMLAVEGHYERYTYTASVITDLMYRAVQQAESLDK